MHFTPPYHVLVVGVGSIGQRHVRCFLATGRARVSICEINPALRAEVARRYDLEHHFSDLDEALKHACHAAVIAVPAHRHIPIAQLAVEAGLDLLIEKPLSTALEGIDSLRQTVARLDRVAAIAYVYRSHPALAAMKGAIDSGRWGDPVELVAVAGQHFPTYRPAYREIYYRDRATGGGAIQDALTHLLNAGEWLVGPIDRVVADASHQVLAGVDVEDTVHLLARQGTVLSSYALNQHQGPNENSITVICQHGTARFEYHHQRWQWLTDGDWQEQAAVDIGRDTLFIRQAESFLDAIQRRAQPLCDLEEGLQTLRVNLAALKSVEQGRWVDVR
jgi:predicted dehydrogenase